MIANELQQELYSILDESVSIPVYDRPPEGAKLPYVEMGDLFFQEWDTDQGLGFDVTATLVTHYAAQSRAQLNTTMGEIYGALHRAELVLPSADCIGCDQISQLTSNAANGETVTAVQVYRILVRV